MTDLRPAPAVPFPSTQPPGYEWLPGEPIFDPEVHLRIEPPTESRTLSEFGYGPDEIASTATELAVSAPFRVMSDEGAAVLLDICRRLRAHARPAGDRIEHTVRGGCYRSRFLRDLCLSPDVTSAMSSIYCTDVSPHTMPVHLGHINYEPDDVHAAVDKWHHDTIPLDYVMMVSDPRELPGGQFEYFVGTKDEVARLAAIGERPPDDRVLAPDFGGPGWAIALHGNMVVHRGAPLTRQAERITMVNAYVALDRSRDDQSRSRDLIGVDDESLLYAEWVKHVAWRAGGRLSDLVDTVEFGLGRTEAIEMLESAITDVSSAIDDLRAGSRDAEHYERADDERH